MVGFILACAGHRYRAVAGSNPALPTKSNALYAPSTKDFSHVLSRLFFVSFFEVNQQPALTKITNTIEAFVTNAVGKVSVSGEGEGFLDKTAFSSFMFQETINISSHF